MTDRTYPVALLKFNGTYLIPTELYRTESLNLKTPKPNSFKLATEQPASANNHYRHFKNDLLLSKTDLKDASGNSWEMKTRKGTDSMGEWINEDKDPFNPLMATSIFLEKVCSHAVRRAKEIFGYDQEIHVHFTAPNYAFEDDDVEEGKQKSEVYRRNFRAAVERFKDERPFKNTTFMTDGYDFLYEPYAVYYYYSLLEHGVELSEDQAGKTYLVFDMGGSTTDVSLVQVNRQESDFRLYPVCRSIKRAGAYFDRYILGNLIGHGQAVRRDAKKWNETLERIEQAKIDLCEGNKEEVALDIEGETYTLTRERIGEFLRTLWKNDNLRLGQAFRGFIRDVRTLVKNHGQLLEFNEIEKVFLAGGSTGLPGIEDLIREDLESLGLLNDQMTPCVRPYLVDCSGEDIMPSSLAALGQSASIAEENPDRLIEEFEHVFVRLEDENGHPYSFQRKGVSPPAEMDDDEIFLLDKNELNRKNKLRLGLSADADDEFERISLERSEQFPEAIDLYVRAGANPFPNEPQRTFVGRSKAVDAPPERADSLRFASIVESSGYGGVKVRPSVWYRLLETDGPSRYHDDVSPIRISLKREIAPSDVHICIDFGMNNTVVAFHAPGRDFPSDADDLVVFPFTEVADALDAETLLRYFPLEPLSKEATVEGISALDGVLHDAAHTDLCLRCARGAYVTRYVENCIQEGVGSNAEVYAHLSDTLRERTSLTIDADMLHEEADTFRRMLRRHDGDIEAVADWLCDAHEENPLLSFEQIQRRHNEVEPLPWPSNNDENGSKDDKSDEDDSMQAQTSQDGDRTKKSSEETEAGKHWAEGLAQWIDERIANSTQPLRKSADKVDEALSKLNGVAKALQETNGQPDSAEALKKALKPLNEQLKQIASSLNSSTDAGEGDEDQEPPFDKQISARVEEDSSPLSRPASEDNGFEAFEEFVGQSNLIYSEKVLRQVWTRCISASGPLVILAGPPGSGKTSLVRLLAKFFNREAGDDESGKPGWQKFHHLQPVSPSWFSPDDLLGSYSVMHERFLDTPFLRFLTKAECHYYAMKLRGKSSRLFFACLDEFNIAQPEQYLADILSKMEAPEEDKSSERTIMLCSAERLGRDSSLSIELTPNIRLFATINTDVSTKTLSPKVLDRSFFVRLTPEQEQLREAAENMKGRYNVAAAFHDAFTGILADMDELARAGQSPLGFRLIEQAYAYAGSHPMLNDAATEKAASAVIEEVLINFFLPKLPGAFSIDDPEAKYESLLRKQNGLREYPEVSNLLNNIQKGLPGQAAL